MLIGARIDQLRRDTHRIAGFSHAAFEKILDTELLGYGGSTQIGLTKLKRRGSRSDFESVNVSEYVEDLFRNTVGKITLISLGREVRKGKHGDRCVPRRRRHPGRLHCGGTTSLL